MSPPAKSVPHIRVIIADDHMPVREGLAAILKPRHGMEVVAQARDGQEAIEMFQEYRPDVALIDLRMPRMDGLSATQQILEYDPDACVVVLTAFAGEEENSRRAGAKAVIPKDASREELLNTIRAVYASQRRQTEVPLPSQEPAVEDLAAGEHAARPAQEEEPGASAARNTPLRTIRHAPSYQARTWLRAALAGMDEAVLTIDDRCRITYLNPAAAALIGAEPQDARRRRIDHVCDLVEESTGRCLHELLAAHAREDWASNINTQMLLTVNDKQTPVQISIAPIQDDDGSAMGAVVVLHDDTIPHNDRRRLEDLNSRLRESQIETYHRVKNHFQIAAALVDIRTEDEGKPISSESLRKLKFHIQALAHIHDLLTHESREGTEMVDAPARDTLEKLIRLLRATITDRTIRFHSDYVRLSVKQSTSLALLVNELALNAVKHGQNEIVISLTVANGTATLEVTDDGPGFPPGFNPTTSANTGLILVNTLVTYDLDGTIVFGNRPEGGGRVTATFPVEGLRSR